jgi:hypothetical protein
MATGIFFSELFGESEFSGTRDMIPGAGEKPAASQRL